MSDTAFLSNIIAEICNYAVTNGMEPDDTLGTVADSILALLENSTFNSWAFKEESSPPHWIPVTEKLPEEYVDVLCYYEYFRYGEYNCMFRTIDRGYYGHGRWGGEAGEGYKNKVLYWMPLPKPPEEAQE